MELYLKTREEWRKWLEENQANNNFLKFSASSRRMYIDWLNSAKKTETRSRRIEKIIGLAERNIKPGMM